MTTDTKALIEEARELANYRDAPHVIVSTPLLRRLAAALEEAKPPEGWRMTEYTREDGAYVKETWRGEWRPMPLKGPWISPRDTARAAMEALEEGESK